VLIAEQIIHQSLSLLVIEFVPILAAVGCQLAKLLFACILVLLPAVGVCPKHFQHDIPLPFWRQLLELVYDVLFLFCQSNNDRSALIVTTVTKFGTNRLSVSVAFHPAIFESVP
jgi:hypothetical protein